ncbi:Nuclear pore complex protein Nup85 [Trichostrongylus colubriformis]|uniref:Nuclear pore complex protein Nup85 n=1 Tax=Trichostrongylus colubriformis TaxID=6319 RepID=A0AAN8J3I3_TRICO
MLTTVKKKMKIGGKQKRADEFIPGCLSRSMSVLSGIDFDEEFVFPARPNATEIQFADNVPNSSTASTANSFRRSNSVESEASSGFGGSNGFAKHDSEETTCQHQDLLELLEKLHAEIALKDCRLRDVEDYMDKLIARVMEHNPELLAAPIQENTPSNHENSFGSSTSSVDFIEMVTAPDAFRYACAATNTGVVYLKFHKNSQDNKEVVEIRERSSALRLAYASPVIRQLLIEMHCVFEKCRQLTQHERLNTVETLSISREYRSALLHCAEEVGGEENIHMRDFTIWSLFETMFFKQGDTPICLDLISWGMESFTFIDRLVQKASNELLEDTKVGDGCYWKTVCNLLIGCRFDTCIDFLNMLKGDKAAERFTNLLSSLDWNWLTDEGKIPKLDRWKHELNSLLTSGAFDSNRNILFLAQLLSGSQKYLERAASNIVNEWWHLMPLYTFVKDAAVPYNELGSVAVECRNMFLEALRKQNPENQDEVEDTEGEFDPFLSILCMKDISVLQNLITNPWLSVHLIDTLMHTDSEYSNVPALIEIRDLLLMEYGSGLIENSCLWEVGADYLLHCGSEGRLRLENHIEEIYIQDDEMAENLMRICIEQELDDSKACIVNTMTYRYLRDGEWSAALSWALRGGRGAALDTTVNEIVWHAEKGEIASLSMLDHMADYVAELGSPSLSFLFNYCRFHRSLNAGDVRSDAPV